jgi:hypothetical protein
VTAIGTVSFRGSDQQADFLAQCLREQGLEVILTRASEAVLDAGDEQVDHRLTIAPRATSGSAPGALRIAARKGAEEFRTRFPEAQLVIQITEGGRRAY